MIAAADTSPLTATPVVPDVGGANHLIYSNTILASVGRTRLFMPPLRAAYG